jgi:uncharacterized protein (TIGR02145 family)
MKKTIQIPFALIIVALLVCYGCEQKQPDPPEGKTNKINFNEISTESSYRNAEITFKIENLDKNDLSKLGVCYNKSGEPSIKDSSTSVTFYSSNNNITIKYLSPDTKYYFRIYARINNTIVYSKENNFTTKPTKAPDITTGEITNITDTSAVCNGYVTDNNGSDVTAKGVCWNKTGTPMFNDNKTKEGAGLGSFTSKLTGLTDDKTYYVRAYARNDKGTSYGNERSFTTTTSLESNLTACDWNNDTTFTDTRDGQEYKQTKIGDQCWMAENLNYNQSSYGNDWCYDNNSSNCDTYGRLYDWAAVMQGASSSNSNPSGVQGVCPDGWHVPSDEEWKELEMQLGMSQSEADTLGDRGTNEGSKLASIASLWDSGDLTNNSEFGASGFTALPGGRRHIDGYFTDFGTNGRWWSSSEYSSTDAWDRGLSSYFADIYRSYYDKGSGYSVRCVKD